MSEREVFTQALADNLRELRDWTAPYGILVGIESAGRGKVRTITFGVARYLDATIKVFSPTYIILESAGPMARYGSPLSFKSSGELLEFIKEHWV